MAPRRLTLSVRQPVPPIDYTDPESGCEYEVKFEGFFAETANSQPGMVYTICPKASSSVRSSGGVIGGCNWQCETVYVPAPTGGGPGSGPDGPGGGGGGGGGCCNPPPVIIQPPPGGPPLGPPTPPPPGPDGEPWWVDALQAALGGVVGAIVNQIMDALNEGPVAIVGEQELTMNAACNYNEEGEKEKMTIFYPEQNLDQALLSRINDIPAWLEQHLAWKTPVCHDRVEFEGDWVTINWISDEATGDSPLRLRKRSRYRSKSDRDSKQLQDYFRDFEWDAGEVCVIHAGAWWGTPQVWASTADEGKRVIRHLGGEAGLDPDQVGRWKISGSNNPRIGQVGHMRIRYLQGFPWVSRRQGSNMLPM